MDQTLVFLTLLGMMFVTYLPRLLPVWLLATRKLPEMVIAWLRYVPSAVLAAMLIPSILLENQHLHLSTGNLYLMAFFPTVLVAWKTKSLFGAVMTGMILVALARFFL